MESVLTDLHTQLGRSGQRRTELATRGRFWRPQLRLSVQHFCQSCATFATFKPPSRSPRAPLKPTTTGFLGERVGLVILRPLPISVRGFEYVLVMVDYFTKWAEAVPLLRQDAASVANAISRTWISRWGAPLSLHSDCVPNSQSQLLQELYEGSKDFSCWLRRLNFHLDDVSQNKRSRTVLQHLADDQMNKALDAGLIRHTPFQVLCDQLQRLFQPPLSIEEAIDQLLKRSLRSHETPRQFVDALLRLARDAYPSLSAADRDQVVLYHFKRGLGSQEAAYSLRIQPPGDLNEAIQRASRMLTTDAPTGDNHSRAELWKTTPDRRQQNNTSWPRPHYQPSQRFNRGNRPTTFHTPYRPPPLNAEPRQFRGDRDSAAAAITRHIVYRFTRRFT
nr:unnamed protein product [Spirometra erinaceieuropaei]